MEETNTPLTKEQIRKASRRVRPVDSPPWGALFAYLTCILAVLVIVLIALSQWGQG